MSLEEISKEEISNQSLLEAAQIGDVKLLEAFFAEGQDPNAANEHGVHLIHLAAQENHPDAVKFLIESGANVNALTQDGWTALHFAAREGFIKIVKILLEAGVNFDIPGIRYNRTALHYAAEVGQVEVVKELIKKGASLTLKDKNGETAVDLARKNNRSTVVQMLESL